MQRGHIQKVLVGAGVVTAVAGLGTTLAAIGTILDSAHSGINKSYMAKLQEQPEITSTKLTLMEQLADNPIAHYPLAFQLRLIKEADECCRTGDRTPLTLKNPVPGDPSKNITLQKLATDFDQEIALKAVAFYEPDSKTLILSFPGMDATQDLVTVDKTIGGNVVETELHIRRFMEKVRAELEKFKGLPVENCVLSGHSLGAGSTIYALQDIIGHGENSLTRNEAQTVLMEPWKAHETIRKCTQLPGSAPVENDPAVLGARICEVRCYPGTALAHPDNPAVGTRRCGIMTPVLEHTKEKLTVLGRFLFHSHLVAGKDLLRGHAKVVKAEGGAKELSAIRCPHFITALKEAIEHFGDNPAGYNLAHGVSKAITGPQNRVKKKMETETKADWQAL